MDYRIRRRKGTLYIRCEPGQAVLRSLRRIAQPVFAFQEGKRFVRKAGGADGNQRQDCEQEEIEDSRFQASPLSGNVLSQNIRFESD